MENEITLYFRDPPGNHEEEKQLVNNLAIIQSKYPQIKLVSLAPFKLSGFEILDSSHSQGTIIFSDRFFWPEQMPPMQETTKGNRNICYFSQESHSLYFWNEQKLVPAPSEASEGLVPYEMYNPKAKYEVIYERPKNLLHEYVETPFSKKALFLDRDGIVIEDTHYPHKIEDLKIRPEAVELIRNAKEKGYLIVLLSNQAGVAKEKFTFNQMQDFHQVLEHQLYNEYQIQFDDFHYCPFHKDGTLLGFNEDSFDRKPQLGMLLKATQKLKINLRQSIMVGDKTSDNFHITGLRFYLLKSEYCDDHPNLINTLSEIEL
jgi:D-glycero-D-manno-heptose 1,7-bisphosphate phosphatase